MATIQPTLAQTNIYNDIASNAVWNPLANGDVGGDFVDRRRADRCVQVQGTFGAGGTVLIEGSLDGVNYFTLRDPQGVALSFTATGLKEVLEITNYIRPRVSAGDGTTAIVVILLAKGRA